MPRKSNYFQWLLASKFSYKHELALELIKAKEGPKTIEPDSVNTQSWKQEDITKLLDGNIEN